MNIDTEELCSVVQGQFLQKVDRSSFTGVSIDSRESNLKQKIFFAIQGTHFDGHDFLQQALKAGVAALVVHKKPFIEVNSVPVIQVDDTLKALHRLAFHWRKKNKFSVIGITGSSGKTTTKNFCLKLLEGSFSVIGSPKSFNNVYGVPLTLLSAKEDTDILVQEMGMNQKGEIKLLCQLAQPDIVTVTQVGDSHVGMLGSRDGIAQEKKEIYLSTPAAARIFNLDNLYTKKMYEDLANHERSGKIICFSSQDEKADIFLQIKEIKKFSLSVAGHFQGVKGFASVPVVGAVHLSNLMAAAGLALAAGLKEDQMWERLSLCRLPAGRNQWLDLSSGAQALFDAYNASPESVMALLEYFLSPMIKGKKILILGDFLELGSYLESFQKKVASKLFESEVSLIWFIGSQSDSFAQALKEANYTAEFHFSRQFDSSVAEKILSMLDSSVSLAFKASRKMQMEKVLEYFKPVELFTWPTE